MFKPKPIETDAIKEKLAYCKPRYPFVAVEALPTHTPRSLEKAMNNTKEERGCDAHASIRTAYPRKEFLRQRKNSHSKGLSETNQNETNRNDLN